MVFWTASSSLCTVNLSLLTFARAEAMFASRVAALSVGSEIVVDDLADEPPVSVPPVWVAISCFLAVVLCGEVVAGVVVVEMGTVVT